MKSNKFGQRQFYCCLLFQFLLLAVPNLKAITLPSHVTILTREDFANHNFYSVGDALDMVPSIKMEREGDRGSRVTAKMRGAPDPKETIILLNGTAMNNIFDGAVDLSQFPLNMVERIEITRGGSSAANSGEAVGGAINIVTSRPQSEDLLVELGYGVGRDGVRTSNGRFIGRSPFYGDFTYLPSRELVGGFQKNNEVDATTHFGSFARSFNGKGYWAVEYFHQESDVGLPHGTQVPLTTWDGHREQEPSTGDSSSREKLEQAKVTLASPVIFGGTFYFDAAKAWRDTREFDLSDSTLDPDTTNKTEAFHLKWVRGGFEVGGSSKRDKEENAGEMNRRKFQSSLFILKKWEAQRWVILPSVRYDHLSTSKGYLNPRLTALYRTETGWMLSSSAQRAIRVPTFDELYHSSFTSPNPGLNAEESLTFDAGLAFNPGQYFRIGTTGFFTKGKNLIWGDSQSNRFENSGRKEAVGSETEVWIRAGENRKFFNFTAQGNWTHQRSRRVQANSHGFKPTAMTPKNILNFKLTQHLPKRLNISNEIRIHSRQYQDDNLQGLKMPSFYIWNIRLQKKILGASLYLDVENVTNRRFATDLVSFTNSSGSPSFALVPHPARTVWAGVSIQFLN